MKVFFLIILKLFPMIAVVKSGGFKETCIIKVYIIKVYIFSTPLYGFHRDTDTTELSFNKLIKFDIHHRQ